MTMNTWGENIKFSIFGESHGGAVGAVFDGIPSGTPIDTEYISKRMQRRRPGKNKLSTARTETDSVEILSGLKDGLTCGTPLCGIIRNSDMRSSDYNGAVMRPGHADYTAYIKYGESRDFRGGGHFSGRLTAALVFGGAIAEQVLLKKGITIGTHISKIGGVCDTPFDLTNIDADTLSRLENMDFPVVNPDCAEPMMAEIESARADADSVGGILECAICGIDRGIGSPFFGSVESRISSMMFSIPAIKGLEFGAGFNFGNMRGSAANDEFYISEDGNSDSVKTRTNNNAGINGGITNGMPIVFRLAVKPTPSIGKIQNTIDIEKRENVSAQIRGRHDPCIVHRAAPVVSAAAAIAVLDMLSD